MLLLMQGGLKLWWGMVMQMDFATQLIGFA
jgi:hypothetical protein